MVKVMMRAAIRLLLIVLFLGTVMLWIIKPTSTYKKKWSVSIQAKTNSPYFGTQGSTLLVNTFPLMFIAFLGCIYLSLGKKCEDDYDKSTSEKQQWLRWWKWPVLVKGPLGIVSGIEASFIIMFTALLVWSLSTYLTRFFSLIPPAETIGELGPKLKVQYTGLALGLVGNIGLTLLFFPVSRGSSVLPLLGLTSEGSIKYHIWLGHLVMILLTAHGLCYIIFWASTNLISQMITKWQTTEVSNVAGELSLLAGLAMWVTTLPRIRRQMFELFFYTHYLYIVFIIFFVLHVGFSYACIMLPGFYLFLIDRYLRFLQSRQSVRLLSSRVLPCEAVELNLLKSPELSYTSTSIIFINIPSISKLQWHPFTITSNSNLEPERLSLLIKREGSWSRKLYQMLSSSSPIERLEVAVEGPYGPVSTHFLRHDKLVMVCGGSGITPFISIIREFIFRSTTMNSKTPKVLLICAFKSSQDLTMLDLLLPISSTVSDISRMQLQIEAFVTREKQQATASSNKNLNLRTIWFKPSASDMPIYSVLGPNSWVWLGLIISSSFIIFLALLAVLTRYYIYPIDHNSNQSFSWTTKSLLSMLIICVSIAMTATAVFLKNKKRNWVKAKQIQITSAPSPVTSPSSWFHNADRELESLPNQSLIQSTNVHYGTRPNLKKMLLECEESSVGVLACGPRKMRHEVATICSSGITENLHFESISFSW